MPTELEDRKLQRSRVTVLAVIVLVVFLGLLARLWYLQVAMGDELLKQSQANWDKLLRTRAPRGSILYRDGEVLATSRPQFVVMAIPEILKENDEAARTLCDILHITDDDLEFAIKKSQPRPGLPVRLAVDVPLETVARIGELRMMLPGVSVELDQIRHYPDECAVAHIMGSLGEINRDELKSARQAGLDYHPGDYVGKSGLEKQYEHLLHGKDGGKKIKVNAFGRVVKILGEEPSIPGKTLTLTIDRALQFAAYRAMGIQVGAVVALDPKTGAVLAMVSKPDYDPNIFVKRISRLDWDAILHRRALQNRCVYNPYPPGSAFKPLVAVAGLAYDACDVNTTVTCKGVFHLGRFRFRCWKTHGHVDFAQAIAQSCDVWFYNLGRRLGIERMAKVAREFGIGSKTGIDLPKEKSGIMPDPEWKRRVKDESWYPGETVISAIGQGSVEATPLQMAVACSGIAESGEIFRPFLLREVREPGGKRESLIEPEVVRRVDAPEEKFHLVQSAMQEAVAGRYGTGRACNLADVTVAGKTGSAEAHGGGDAHGWFICFAPVDQPQIAIACIIEHGKHGSSSAAPVCRALLDVYFGKKKPEDIAQHTAYVSGD